MRHPVSSPSTIYARLAGDDARVIARGINRTFACTAAEALATSENIVTSSSVTLTRGPSRGGLGRCSMFRVFWTPCVDVGES